MSVNDDEGNFKRSSDGTELKVRARDFEFNDDESDVVRLITPGPRDRGPG
jgi:hypothetical protein